MQPRLKVLLSAYACAPERGSEPGVGWNWVRQIGGRNDAWVITRKKNRRPIEQAVAKDPLPNVSFIYFDLPRWARFWKKGRRGLYPYYYLWQLCAYFLGRRLHRQVRFDLVHHLTFVTYWMPSFLSLLPPPFIWGPVGGGESAPGSFWSGFSVRGKISELLRAFAQRLGSLDPFVRLTARRAVLGLATTPETAQRLQSIGCRHIQLLSQVGLSAEELEQLGSTPHRAGDPLRALSVGNLLHWKGFELVLRAVAKVNERGRAMEYWLVGDGPERKRLEKLARDLGLKDKAIFWGAISRSLTFEKLAQCDVMVHPSLHESGGFVCAEAMAAGCPVICLDLGGPAIQVTEETGIKVPAISPKQVIHDLAEALDRLANDPELRARLSQGSRRRAAESFAWDKKGDWLTAIYLQGARECS